MAGNNAENVAVIAVHGVADQKPNETAKAAADLLMHLDEVPEEYRQGLSDTRYPGFEHESLRIATAGINLDSLYQRDEAGNVVYDDRKEPLPVLKDEVKAQADGPWLDEAAAQLANFKLERSSENYDTLRLEGSRLQDGQETGIHVYEMYWADLSRLGNKVFSILIALYRLLFELAWVGTRGLGRLKEADYSNSNRFLHWIHRSYAVAISCTIPLCNIFLMALLVVIGSAALAWFEGENLNGSSYRILFSILFALMTVGIYAGWLRRNVKVKPRKGKRKVKVQGWIRGNWEFKLVTAVLLALGSGWLMHQWLSEEGWTVRFVPQVANRQVWTESLLAVLLWFFLLALIWRSVVKLIEQRQGKDRTYWVGGPLIVILTALLAIGLTVPTPLPRMVSGGAFALVMGVAILGIVWMVILFQAGAFAFLGQFQIWRLKWRKRQFAEDTEDSRALQRQIQTLQTAILAITLPTMLTMLLNVGLWWAAIVPLKKTGLLDNVVRNSIEHRERQMTRGEMLQTALAVKSKFPAPEEDGQDDTAPTPKEWRDQLMTEKEDEKVVEELSRLLQAASAQNLAGDDAAKLREQIAAFQGRKRPEPLVPPAHWALNLEKQVIPISQSAGFLSSLDLTGINFSRHKFLIKDAEFKMPKKGRNLTVLARYGGNVHARMFDATGARTDLKGLRLYPKQDEVEELEKLLRSRWGAGELDETSPLRAELIPLMFRFFGRSDFQFSALVDKAMNNTVLPYVNLAFVLVLLLMVASCWLFLPALLSEGTPHSDVERKVQGKVVDPEEEAARHDVLSGKLGATLHNAFAALERAQILLVVCIIGILAGTLVRQLTMARLAKENLEQRAETGRTQVDLHVSGSDLLFLGISRDDVLPLGILKPGDKESERRLPIFQRALNLLPLEKMETVFTLGLEDDDRFYKHAESLSKLIAGLAATAYVGIAVLMLLANTALGNFARPLFDSFRSGMDVALDVVNYMRFRPNHHNVRSQILCRFASLLRFVTSWRSPDTGKPYDRIVILAHSQGTVITADILKLLKHERVAGDNNLELLTAADGQGAAQCPIRVFTMGSPLKQLYAQRFPATYGWACNQLGGAGIQTTEFQGVEMWWNAYRSGDYVGRYLWRTDADCFVPYAFDPALSIYPPSNEDDFPTIREYCLSPGAHTQYWNETAPEVMRDLDRLVGNSGRPADSTPAQPSKSDSAEVPAPTAAALPISAQQAS